MASDDVYPLFMLDDNKILHGIVVTWTLRFNDLLDADRLHTSLCRLLSIGDWRKVGGRLVRKVSPTSLEIHVPPQFTPARPALTYSHTANPSDIDDHPLAKTLPKATPTPSIQRGSNEFRDFECRKDAPATLEDYLINDTPILSLHITSFNDATIIGLTWPHVLMDVMGQQALLRGWSLVLAGKESEVPALLGAREDALLFPDNQEVYHPQRLQGFGMFKFGLRFVADLLWNRVVETRTIFLPKAAVAKLQLQAQEDLSGEFVSEGDVLTAWATRAVASSMPPRPITALHPLNLRFRLPSLIEAPGVFVQNMAVSAFSLFTPELLRGPLGPIALENRRQLMEQATEPQLLALLREMRQSYTPGSDTTVLCGESHALLMPFTNWTRANVYQAADFSSAVVRAGEGDSRNNPPGTIVYQHANSMRSSPTMRNVVVIHGKDHGDNYWLTALLLPAAWAKIEEEIKKL
ncbi:hypothetical protein VE01_09919 [Pseudogymnoascus verrucosus]|uniref:Uncharacterized protein n=1 Tax=Pseudogymnoascus verrucosus TaxID=342668 RepID=A0A1B8G816_9PEZI|nr:uncharacterized protein VE01_09919 [Pseudogymnoascus verrucosus]OBT91973.1 hypothetical protein VE01_09919 [Pseudogymnoascus verrucosus]